MRVLFLMNSLGFIRNFETAVTALATAGHVVHISYESEGYMGELKTAQDLVSRTPGVSLGQAPARRSRSGGHGKRRQRAARYLRSTIDYLGYLDPRYDGAQPLRRRAAERAPRFPRAVGRFPGIRAAPVRGALGSLLRALERALPVDDSATELIENHAPDVVLLTPLIWFASDQVDYLRAARRKGIPTALGLGSWDHLTTKGAFYDQPDRVFVWNAVQKKEAAEYHGIAGEKIVVTGAHSYDGWFHRRPTDRAVFCRRVGLDADKPFVCYVGSSKFIAPEEAATVGQWLSALRSSSDPRLRALQVLVRPHPQNPQPWTSAGLYDDGLVAVWPEGGMNPLDTVAKQDYFDSLCHCAAVIGLNTSALIEAGIVDRPVLSLYETGFSGTRPGTIHVHYLSEGGLVYSADSAAGHFHQLADLLAGNDEMNTRRRDFVASFVRPHGHDEPAARRFVEALEGLRTVPVAPPKTGPFRGAVARGLLYPFIGSMALVGGFPSGRSTKKGPRAQPKQHAKPVWAGTAEIIVKTHAKQAVDRLKLNDKPVLVGPWLGEVGFEILYWIPFLRWVRERAGLDEKRFVIISRGGVEPWYRGICGRYVELFDLYEPGEFQRLNRRRIAEKWERQGKRSDMKQRSIDDFDMEILDKVLSSLSIEDAELVHPSLMYEVFRPYWADRLPFPVVKLLTRQRLLTAAEYGPPPSWLPEDYVAVKFYNNLSFPATDENRALVKGLLRRISQRSHIVLLDPGLKLDDHDMFEGLDGSCIHSLTNHTARTNLYVQTQVLCHARFMLGTYGGFSYLGPLHGVDTIAVYSQPRSFSPHHLEYAQRVYRQLGGGALTVVDARNLGQLDAALWV